MVGKIIKLQAGRHTVQMVMLVIAIIGILPFIGMTGFIYPFYFCYACPFAWASCPIGILEHSFIDFRNQGIIEGFYLLFYVLGIISIFGFLFGRYICGWVCPIGALQDLLGFGRSKVVKEEIPRLYFLRWIKYALLVFIPISSIYLLETFFTNKMCPVGVLTGTIPQFLLDIDGWQLRPDFPFKMISLGIFFLLVIVVARGWCRFLCPLGAWLSFYNKITPLNVSVDKKKCVSCGLCTKNCPMKIDVPNSHRSLECIGCTRCIHNCNKEAITLNIFKRRLV
jgi:polyferredoxin